MKLLTRKEYECLSPVKRSVYEKRVKKYYGTKRKDLFTEPTMLYDPWSGLSFTSTKDLLDATETALSILAEDENMTIDEAMIRLYEEVGL